MKLDIEKKLNRLPKGKLSRKADYKIRLKLFYVRWKKRLIDFPVAFEWPRLQPVWAVALVLLLSIIIVPGYAYASDKVTLGHVLYPVKTALEQAELKLSETPEEQVKTYEKLAGRRLAEANVLSRKGEKEEEKLVKTVSQAVNLSETAVSVAETKPGEEVDALVERAQSEQVSALTEVAQNVGIDASEETVDNIALALDKIRKSDKKGRTELKWDWKGRLPKAVEKDESEENKESDEDKQQDKKELTKGHDEAVLKEITPETKPPKERREPEKTDPAIDAADLQPEEKKENKEKRKEEKEDIKRSLEQAKKEIAEFKKVLPKQDYEPEDIESLFKHLDDKLKRAENEIEKDNFDNFQEILKATGAVTNNATYFIKEKQSEKIDKDKKKEKDKDKGEGFFERFKKKNNKKDKNNDSNDEDRGSRDD